MTIARLHRWKARPVPMRITICVIVRANVRCAVCRLTELVVCYRALPRVHCLKKGTSRGQQHDTRVKPPSNSPTTLRVLA